MSAKTEGQALSVAPLSDATWAEFERIIATAPAQFSINDIREQLDTAQIPDKARGGLFAGAVAKGLIEPLTLMGYPCSEPSTGPSAHHATVRIYVQVTKAAA